MTAQQTSYERNSNYEDYDQCHDSIPTVDLDEFVVKGENYNMTGDKITISPSEAAVSGSMFALDLLGKLGIPGLTYRAVDQEILVNGKRPVFLINGVIADTQQIRNIKASDVISVQFSNTVPLVYRKYGDCMIDIRVRTVNDGGYVMIRGISDITFTAPDALAATTYNRGSSKIHGYYYYTHRSNRDVSDTDIQTFSSPLKTIHSVSDEHSPFHYNIHVGNLDYVYNPSQDLVFQANFKIESSDTRTSSDADVKDSFIGDASSSYRRIDKKINPALDLYLQKSFNDANMLQIQLNGVLHNTDYDFYNSFITPEIDYDYDNFTRSRRQSLISTVAYTHTFSPSTILEACYENTISHTRNTYTDNGLAIVNELNNYIYIQFRKRFGQFSISANTGVRFDRITNNDLHYLNIHNTSAINAVWNISRVISAHLDAGYTPVAVPINRLIARPQQASHYLVTTGNPDLKKSEKWDISLYAPIHKGIFTFIPSIAYSRTLHPIGDVYTYNAGNGVFIATPENLHYSDRLDLKAQASVSGIAGFLNINGAIAWSDMQSTGYNGNHIRRRSAGGNISVEFYLKNWVLGYEHDFPLWSINGYSLRRLCPSDMLTLTWRPTPNWQISANWMYMFRKYGYAYDLIINAPGYSEQFNRSIHNNANMVKLDVTYFFQFGNAFDSKGRERTLHKTDTQTTTTSFDR